MPSLRDLQEQRSGIADQMRALADNPTGDGGDLSDDEAKKFDGLKADLGKIEKRIERQTVLDDAQRRISAPAIIRNSGDGNFETRARGFSLVKAILARLGEDVDVGFEREISAEVRRRAQRSFAGIAVPDEYFLVERRVIDITPGGSPGAVAEPLYPVSFRPDMFIDRLRSALVVQRAGATVLDGLVGTVDIPRQVGSVVAQHVVEDQALSRTDPSFADLTLSPRTVGAVTSYTRRTLLNALPAIEGIVRNDLAATVAQAIDYQALLGTGGVTPLGVRNTPGVNDLTLAGPTWAQVLAFPTEIQAADADLGSMAWIMTPDAVAILRGTLKTTADAGSNFLMDEPGSLGGYPALTTTLTTLAGSPQMAVVFFGAWSQLIVGYWSGLDVLVNPYSEDDYLRGRVSVRAMRDYDVAVRHPESFAFAEDLSAG